MDNNINFNNLYKNTTNSNNNFDTKESDDIFPRSNNTYVNELNNVVNSYINASNNITSNNINDSIKTKNFESIKPVNSINNPNINTNNNISNNLDTNPVITPINIVDNLNYKENNSNIVTNNNEYNISRIEELKNKSNNKSEYIFNDGLDTLDDTKNKIVSLLTNRKFLYITSILAFVLVSIVVIKTFYFGNKIDHYEAIFTEITKKEEEEAKIYADGEIDSNILRKVAADELIECIKSPVDINNLPSSINDIVKEINNYYNRSNNYFAFVYKDLFTGFTVSYNANQPIFTASAIKAPTDIYIYEMASLGKANLDEMVTYTGAYYNTGSGVLKNKPINTKYSVRTLLEYSTVTSDNAAHNMLMDKYGRENMLNFWQSKGTKAIFTANNNWGVLTANDSMIYMSELYNFYLNNEEYGSALMNNFLSSYPKFIKGKEGYKIASKSGWSGTALHDVSIIFADNPYIVVGLSNLGNSNYTPYFNNVSSLSRRLHEEYWKYKINTCNGIKQF